MGHKTVLTVLYSNNSLVGGCVTKLSLAESQKGVSAAQQCSVEIQKGAIAIDIDCVQRLHPSGFQWNILEQL